MGSLQLHLLPEQGDLLLQAGVKVRLKAMIIRSNMHQLEEIFRFCRERTKDYFRFDPELHLRYDHNPQRNSDILAERLSPEEVVAAVEAAIADGGVLRLTDDKGRQHLVPGAGIAYVEVGEPTSRRVGFGAN